MKEIPIIFENDEIIIVNKPAGVSVQGGAGIKHPLDETLSEQLGYKVHLVHRLDKETCGLLIVAKTPFAASVWTKLIASGSVKKEYTAVCFGVPKVKGQPRYKGTIQAQVSKGVKEMHAITRFHVEKTWKISIDKGGSDSENEPSQEIELAKINLTLGTGRMHQIRIHLADSGAPIAGDDRHGDFKLNKIAKKAGIKSLLLCSRRITLPINGEPQTFEIEDPFTVYEQ